MAIARLKLDAELDILNKGELVEALKTADAVQYARAQGMKHFGFPVLRSNAQTNPITGGAVTLGGTSVPGQPNTGPRQGYTWRVVRVSVAGLTSSAATALSGTGTFTSAGGSAALSAGSVLNGFDVTAAAPGTPPVSATVTVTNVAGGPYTYTLTEGAAGGTLSIRYPVGLVASGGAPTVAVAAAAGGASGSIDVYGQFNAVNDSLTMYKGDPGNDRFVATISAAQPWWTSSHAVLLKAGEFLTFVGSNLAASTLAISGEVYETPAELAYKLIGG